MALDLGQIKFMKKSFGLGTPYFEQSEPGVILGRGEGAFTLSPPQTTYRLFFGQHRLFFPFSHNAEPGPRLILFIIRGYTVTNLATWNLKHPIFGFSLDHSWPTFLLSRELETSPSPSPLKRIWPFIHIDIAYNIQWQRVFPVFVLEAGFQKKHTPN